MSINIEQKIAKLNKALAEAKKIQDQNRGKKTIRCDCGKMHRIKDCEVIQTHWYVSPSGCTDGDYWNEGELEFVCPETKECNRLLFEVQEQIDWEERIEYENDLEAQFKHLYKRHFKHVTDEYEHGHRMSVNNFYVDQNYKKFGLSIKARKTLEAEE